MSILQQKHCRLPTPLYTTSQIQTPTCQPMIIHFAYLPSLVCPGDLLLSTNCVYQLLSTQLGNGRTSSALIYPKYIHLALSILSCLPMAPSAPDRLRARCIVLPVHCPSIVDPHQSPQCPTELARAPVMSSSCVLRYSNHSATKHHRTTYTAFGSQGTQCGQETLGGRALRSTDADVG